LALKVGHEKEIYLVEKNATKAYSKNITYNYDIVIN
jgi:hypothetical protein